MAYESPDGICGEVVRPSARIGGFGWNSGSPNSSIMDIEPIAQWRIKATAVLQPVTCAKRRLSASLSVNEFAMSVTADELEATAGEATAWMTANECPDLALGMRVAWMLNICVEAALTAKRAVDESFATTEPVLGSLGNLLAVIDIYSQTLEDW